MATGSYRWGILATAFVTTLLVAALAPFRSEIGLLNEGLAFLLLTLLVSATWGWRIGLFAAVLTNLSFNFFFVEPLHTLTVQRPRDLVGLLIFLVVSVVGGSLLSQARSAALTAQRRQAETAVLLQLSRDLIGRADPTEALAALCDNVVHAFEASGASVLSPSDGAWVVLAYSGEDRTRSTTEASDAALAERAARSGTIIWRGNVALGAVHRFRIALPAHVVVDAPAGAAFVPLLVGDRPLGVLRFDGPIGDTPFGDHPEELLKAFAREAALGVQRVELAYEAAHAEALRQADEMKTTLLASVSHDLKTPLAGIKTAVSSLLDQSVAWSAADIQVFLETIDSQADRLDRVISDILDLNRIESGVVRPVSRPIGARQLLDEAVQRTRSSTLGRPVAVDADEALVVLADEGLIVHALINLIENAAKYSSAAGSITLSAHRSSTGVDLSVADEGPGIPPEDLPRIFERFYRAPAHSRLAKGSGLGLAIVQGFITLAGGSVRVESSSEGTRFIITLPAAAAVEVA